MANNSSNNQSFQQELADFRAMQEEMLSLSREYGQERQAAWADETRRPQGWLGRLLPGLAGEPGGDDRPGHQPVRGDFGPGRGRRRPGEPELG